MSAMGAGLLGGWVEYALAFAVFLASHALPVRPAVKVRLVAMFGRRGFTLAYSALSLLALAWLIAAAGRAPYVALWEPSRWQAHVPQLAMLGACALLALALARPNPFSFGGAGNDTFDPARPGIVRLTRHPLLAALALWAGGHVVPNGDLAHVLMFAVLGLFALAGMRMIDRRRRREMGAEWQRLARTVAAGPWLPRPVSVTGAGARLVVAAALYAALLLAHPHLFGVDPLA